MPKLSKVDLVLANLLTQIAELQRSHDLIVVAANNEHRAGQVRRRKAKTVTADVVDTRPRKQTAEKETS